jgi:outer membrane protein assembly factor BamB
LSNYLSVKFSSMSLPANPDGGASSSSETVSGRGPRRAKVLAGWLSLLAVSCAAFWQTGASQDYKNVALQAAVVGSIAGVSVWTLRSSGLSRRARWSLAALAWAPLWAVSPIGPIQLINNGNTGIAGWRWRWGTKPDERLDAVDAKPAVQLHWNTTPRDYPAFLGGKYWAEVEGVVIAPDWEKLRPKELWRKPVGAGWSGFAIVGRYAVTQEQRGERELVVCYDIETGEAVWSHADEARWDPSGGGALGGVGPRATPTVHEGRVYSHGATGILNCIDAGTGELVWSRDTLEEYQVPNIHWGKAGSPLIVDDQVVVSVGGTDDHSLIAFRLSDGGEVWAAGKRRSSYATPVLAELAGVRQIVAVNEESVTAHDAASGAVLWEYPWPGNSDGNASASQPVPVGGDRIFLSKGYGVAAELIQVVHNADAAEGDEAWTAERVWKKPVLRTKLGNVVIRDGFVYGIDDIDMECVELDTGKRQWKKRRRPELGHGQIILVGDKIVVLSESGELVLVEASPEAFKELASMQALDGVTWNNPALSGSTLLVRNAEEMACFELAVLP